LLVFSGQTGATTSGTWDWYFNGSDIALTAGAEDINGLSLTSAEDGLYLTTYGRFRLVNGAAGSQSDIFLCQPDSQSTGLVSNCGNGLGLWVSGKDIGFGAELLDGLQVIEP
jgi:hypothetical protein